MTADASVPLPLPVRRGGPEVMTLRQDRWWTSVVVTVSMLTAFVVYATWAAFQNRYYYVGASMHRDLLSPLYSPCIVNACGPGASHGVKLSVWNFSPALLVLAIPGGFRLTCYYYRRAYYRAFWGSPPACAVTDAHATYTGETRLPLVLQNVHRYFFYLAFLVNIVLTIDAVLAFSEPGRGIGVSVGTLVLCVNAALLWLYTLSCHACRHLCGGGLRSFSDHPLRARLWRWLTPLNARHMQIAWVSLIVVALTDVYVRLVASGSITDYRLF